MSIEVTCQRIGCGASFEAGLETDWSTPPTGERYSALSGLYGPVIEVALPEGWRIDHISSGDAVIHCPEHADD